jgi:hypothetical protein
MLRLCATVHDVTFNRFIPKMKPKVPLNLRNATTMKKTASDNSELRTETTGVSIIVTFTTTVVRNSYLSLNIIYQQNVENKLCLFFSEIPFYSIQRVFTLKEYSLKFTTTCSSLILCASFVALYRLFHQIKFSGVKDLILLRSLSRSLLCTDSTETE